MPVNLMDLYKDESEDNKDTNPPQEPGVESAETANEPQTIEESDSAVLESIVESKEPVVESTVSENVMSEEEKKEYGMTSMPKKIEVEDLEQKTSDFLKDPSLDNDIPDDLEYSSVFKSKTVVNYTLAISGFALLVVGVFSFLNSQSVDIQSSLDVISQTGKGSLADAPPPGMDLGNIIGALQGDAGGAQAGDGGNVNAGGDGDDVNAGGDQPNGGVNNQDEIVDDNAIVGDEDVLVDADDILSDDQTADSDVLLQDDSDDDNNQLDNAGDSNDGSSDDPFSNLDNDDFADLFGPIPGSDSGFFGSPSDGSSDTGSATGNPNDSDLNQLLTDSDIQLDLLDDDSNVNNNGFLSNTNNTIITSGNIAGDSGPEIYLVLFISLIFAGYLTTRTT